MLQKKIEYSKFVVVNYHVIFSLIFHHIQMCEIQLSCCHRGVVSIQMHLKIKTCMFEQLSKPLKMDVIQIFLFDVDCLNFMQNVAASKCDKLIIHCFWIKNMSLDEEIQHCCDYFQF